MKKIISLIISGILMICMVGCGNNYKVKNKEVYNKGYNRYERAEDIEGMNFYGVIFNTIDAIQAFDGEDNEIYDLDGNYLYTIKNEEEYDYEYGKLQFAIDRTKEEKEKDLYYIFENGVELITGKMTKEQKKIIEKYNDSYVECYDETLDLLKEIEDKYGKEDITRDYLDRFDDIRDKQEKILDDYASEMMTMLSIKFMNNLFN